jgi:competence protein ComEA
LLLFFGFALAIAQKNPPAAPVNLNTATIAQLEELPGIGPTTAKSIVDFRERSGPFQRLEDLLAIKGISKARLQKLRPYVTVGPSVPKQQPSGPH